MGRWLSSCAEFKFGLWMSCLGFSQGDWVCNIDQEFPPFSLSRCC